MKIILSLLVLVTLTAMAETPKSTDKKIYSEAEFIKKLTEEVKKQVDNIKNKSIADLTKEILDKEEKLKFREVDLIKRQDALKASEAELARKFSELEARQQHFLGCLDKNEQESKARLGQMVEMIANMKPQKASDVLSVQDSDIAVQILQTIDPKKASKIFNFMEKDVSAKLQKQYLEMKK